MTTRDDDRHDLDERDLDAFVRGEDELSALLRSMPQEAPSEELDVRILAQARAALAGPAPGGADTLAGLPAAANDPAEPMAAPPEEALEAAEDEEAPRPSNPFGHLRVPMALAATLVVGVSLALQLGDWRTPAQLHEDAAPAQPSRPSGAAHEQGGTTVAPDAAARGTAPSVQNEDAAPAPAREPAHERARERAPAPVKAAGHMAGEPAPPPPPPRPAIPAPAAPAMTWPAPAPAPAAPAPAFAPVPDVTLRRSAPAPLAAPAPPAPAVTVTPSSSVQVSGSRVAAPEAQDPDAWLARIGSLLDQHRDAEARTAWLAFRRAYPEAPVPDALRARIDALAPAP